MDEHTAFQKLDEELKLGYDIEDDPICPDCGSDEVSHYEREQMYKCRDCGNKWEDL